MAPLTRNQQAALQANPNLARQHPPQQSASSPTDGHQPSSSSSVGRLRGVQQQQQQQQQQQEQQQQDQAGLVANANIALGQYGVHEKASLVSLRIKQNCQHDGPPDLDQYGHLDNLSFAETTDAVTSAATDAHRLADWTGFGHGNPLMNDMYTDGQGNASQQSSPYFGLSPNQQRLSHDQHQGATHFMNEFGDIGQREQHMFDQSWRQSQPGQQEGNDQNVPLGSPFAPGNHSALKTSVLDNANFGSDNLDGSTRRLSLVQMPSHHLSMGMHALQSHPMGLQLSTPPVGARRPLVRHNEGLQEFHTNPHSMGQMGMQMSAGHDRMFHPSTQGGTPSERFESNRNRLVSQSSSLHSPTPSNGSSTSTAFVRSPHTSISTRRHGGDSSVDTSIDSISNSNASMSADLSRSSSTSDDFMSIGGTSASSKKSIKGKTRLRNIDRKLICEAARDDPTRRQEDLAAQFGIERSTVSKTLKNKDKWLAIKESSDGAMIIKHRNGKFPQLEEALVVWAREEAQKGIYVLDVSIKQRALELAKQCGLGVDSFKASVGWIEKFRERHDLPKQGALSMPITAASLPVGNSLNSPRMGPSVGQGKLGGPPEQQQQQQQQQRKSLRRASTRMRDSRLPSMSGLSEVARSETLLEQVDEEEVEMDAPHSPVATGRSLRTQPSSSSISTEESLQPPTSIHETPKASKRHYDDMNQRPNSSIDSGMAKMHLPAGKADGTADEREGESDEVEMSPLMEKSGSLPNMTKRRRADEAGLQPQQQSSSARQPAFGGRLRSETVHGETMVMADYQQKRPLHAHQRQYSLGGQYNAPLQSISQASPLENMHQTQHPTMQEDAASITGTIISHPAARVSRINYRHYDSQAVTSTAGVPSPIDEQSSEGEGDEHSAALTSINFPLTHVGISEDRQVTLEEARESLDLVLAFIARQPANLSPSDYFVLGNLQGTLSALAGQTQSPQ